MPLHTGGPEHRSDLDSVVNFQVYYLAFDTPAPLRLETGYEQTTGRFTVPARTALAWVVN